MLEKLCSINIYNHFEFSLFQVHLNSARISLTERSFGRLDIYDNFHRHHKSLNDIMQIQLTRHHSGRSDPAEPKGLHQIKMKH